MAELSITITLSDDDSARMLAAFRRRTGNPDLTQEAMLYVLKTAAIEQIKNVVMIEEKAAIEEQKNSVAAPIIT